MLSNNNKSMMIVLFLFLKKREATDAVFKVAAVLNLCFKIILHKKETQANFSKSRCTIKTVEEWLTGKS